MAGRTQTFFEPIELHLEASHLGVQAIGGAVLCHRLGAAFAGEQRSGLLLDFLLPLSHLDRMDAVLLAYLVDRFDSTQRFQSQFRFELRAVHFAFFGLAHFGLSSVWGSLNYCLETGVHFSGPV